ncbi:hypothetical protein LMH87_006967 [Akanthomyces muscarius]|uniref:Uncharacterized protein n=1 Tax=Akanthomyces muscarius TaxID=2231603 RepID=A0A9W8QS68_AKAMU|nr:hypothetical protein LMH87_006967 [Akanthomyces muscarius]KAJ4165332.1 hypothetical protein LMH87_006967 [Akanthomyces muscarius]
MFTQAGASEKAYLRRKRKYKQTARRVPDSKREPLIALAHATTLASDGGGEQWSRWVAAAGQGGIGSRRSSVSTPESSQRKNAYSSRC